MEHSVSVASSAVSEGKLSATSLDGEAVLVTRVQGKACAFSAKCPHIGLSLARGKIENGTLRCPWHGSRFDLRTGRNLDWANSFAGMPMPKWTHGLIAMGKQPAPLKLFAAVEEGGAVRISPAP